MSIAVCRHTQDAALDLCGYHSDFPVTKNLHLRFLLRAAGCLVLALAIWGILLLDPLLGGLRVATAFGMQFLPGDGAAAHATISRDGNWLLQIPLPSWVAQMENTQKIFGRTPDSPPIRIRSMKLPIEHTYPIIFLASFPIFWAVWFAAPRKGATWRGFFISNGVLALVSVVSLIFYAVHTANTMLHITFTGAADFFWSTGRYLVINVLPYATPLVLALLYHPGLQAFVFSGGTWPADSVEQKSEAPRSSKRARARAVKR